MVNDATSGRPRRGSWVEFVVPATGQTVRVPRGFKLQECIIDLTSEDEDESEDSDSDSDDEDTNEKDSPSQQPPAPTAADLLDATSRLSLTPAPPPPTEAQALTSYLYNHPLTPTTLPRYIPSLYFVGDRDLQGKIATNIALFHVRGVTTQTDFETMMEYLLVNPRMWTTGDRRKGWSDWVYERVWMKVEGLRKEREEKVGTRGGRGGGRGGRGRGGARGGARGGGNRPQGKGTKKEEGKSGYCVDNNVGDAGGKQKQNKKKKFVSAQHLLR
ncbi:hypothetical protein DM02DRAFT_664293 [Periconia macrospinosa]|uniref:Uncharacterized protein n=1 Tax=Periconia macrospinosa TaxID=97972 RepID=A0A2V1D0Z5_9PLEO|nr:hypothetical protein DM02DRAFT_664293 [Periconia macrospinosa]